MIDLAEYQKLKPEIDQLQSELDRGKGSKDLILSQIKEEFGVDSVDAAEKLRKSLKASVQKAENAYNEALEQFRDEWGTVLEGLAETGG